jgi:FkbM family methyltransferase
LKNLQIKILKLSIAAAITFVVCVASFYALDRQRLYLTYRCWQLAAAPSSCLRGGHFDFEADLEGARYFGHTGSMIDVHILYYGAYEKPILYFLRDVMKSAYADQGIFLDIGANTGQHSIFMSHYAKEIHAFEPWEPVLRKFRRMVKENGIKNIVIHPYGLGDENSKKPFFRPPDNNLATGSFVEGFVANNSYESELEIQIGDDALKRARVSSVSMIKMDIEGFEKPALKGLRQTLERSRPIVEFELNIDPKRPVSIQSKNELAALFPEKYEFLVFSEKEDLSTGAYFLEASDDRLRFDRAQQHNVVGYPIEKKIHIPLKGPRS